VGCCEGQRRRCGLALGTEGLRPVIRLNTRDLQKWGLALLLLVAAFYLSRQPLAPDFQAEDFVAVDGDSLRRNESNFRLFGIDAPELHQTCSDRMGREYPCGLEAKQFLANLIAGRPVSCTPMDIDRYDRTVVRCRTAVTDVNGEMVRQGWAVAYTRHSFDYAALESEATAARRGLWQGHFQLPEEWRNDHRASRLDGRLDDGIQDD
jgi:endonuclease YncB( thermonuclease family)